PVASATESGPRLVLWAETDHEGGRDGSFDVQPVLGIRVGDPAPRGLAPARLTPGAKDRAATQGENDGHGKGDPAARAAGGRGARSPGAGGRSRRLDPDQPALAARARRALHDARDRHLGRAQALAVGVALPRLVHGADSRLLRPRPDAALRADAAERTALTRPCGG